jgi:hypothetical protein
VSFENQTIAKERTAEAAPEVGCAWVRCGGYRCMAFRDKDGKWRGYYDRQELPEPVEILMVL